MKRFVALALAGSVQLVALAGNPVSVYPQPPAKPAASMSQPLTAAVQSAAATMPAAPVMSSQPSWGSPAVLPGTLVAAPSAAVPCGEVGTCQPVKAYFNPLAAPRNCDVVRGTCLDRLKDWLCFQRTPGGFPLTVTPYRAPARAYFPCKPDCGSGCGAGGGCAPGGGRTSCGPVTMTVQRLGAGCDTPACRPRVMYQPLTARAEVPVAGCDARPVRPRLFERMFSFFTPKWAGVCGDACPPAFNPPPFSSTPAEPHPTTWTTHPAAPVVAPSGTGGGLVPPLSTTPIYGPVVSRTTPASPAQPFTNP